MGQRKEKEEKTLCVCRHDRGVRGFPRLLPRQVTQDPIRGMSGGTFDLIRAKC